MENNPLSKYTVSFGISLALCSVINAVLVVIKEKSPAVASSMAKMSGHHWVTHSAFVVLLFILCGWLLTLPNGGRGLQLTAARLLGTVAAGVITGSVIIIGFYLIAD